MGTKYAAVSVSGYNATPPADDGTETEANKVKWSTIKTKLPDPLKTAIEAIDSRLTTHFDIGPTALTSNTTLDASHHNKVIQASGSSVTLTLTDAATLAAGWFCRIINTDSSNAVTIGRATGGDTINGSAANFTLTALHSIDVVVIAAATGFLVRSAVINPVTTDTTQTLTGTKTFSAATVNGLAAFATFAPTVTLVGGAGNTVPQYTTNTGRYTRIGNVVFADVHLDGNGGDEGAGTGTMTIAIPVASSASHPTETFPVGSAQNGTSEYILFGQIAAGASVITLLYFDTISNRTNFDGNLQNSTTRNIRLKFFYEV